MTTDNHPLVSFYQPLNRTSLLSTEKVISMKSSSQEIHVKKPSSELKSALNPMDNLRKLTSKISLVRAVALATAGSGVFCVANSFDHDTSISISAPSNFWDSFNPPRGAFHETRWRRDFLLAQSNISRDGFHHPFSVADVGPDPKVANGAPGNTGDSPKHSCSCFGRGTFANAAAKIGPAVVNLSVAQSFNGTVGKNIGSGTIIGDNGIILTCAHVVVDFQGLRSTSKGKVEVTLQDGRSYEGTVVNADLHSDIAIVKINSKTPLPTAKLGNSSKLRPGDWVIAMGCPLTLQNTLTAGIISCVDRKSNDLGLGGMQREYLQTDCAIHPGSSGGPLVNADGEVIGVNIMKVIGADGLNFAVPIDSVIKIIEHFKKSGRVVRPWLGLKMIDLNDVIVAHLKERKATFPDVRRGVLVPMVSPGSPGDRAGFRPGDIVVEFGGKPVASIKEVIEIMGGQIGKPLKVVVKRPNDVTATLTVIPEEANPDM